MMKSLMLDGKLRHPKKKKKEARRGEANLRSGILFPEERERERASARESAVWKREKKERVHFSRLTKAA